MRAARSAPPASTTAASSIAIDASSKTGFRIQRRPPTGGASPGSTPSGVRSPAARSRRLASSLSEEARMAALPPPVKGMPSDSSQRGTQWMRSATPSRLSTRFITRSGASARSLPRSASRSELASSRTLSWPSSARRPAAISAWSSASCSSTRPVAAHPSWTIATLMPGSSEGGGERRGLAPRPPGRLFPLAPAGGGRRHDRADQLGVAATQRGPEDRQIRMRRMQPREWVQLEHHRPAPAVEPQVDAPRVAPAERAPRGERDRLDTGTGLGVRERELHALLAPLLVAVAVDPRLGSGEYPQLDGAGCPGVAPAAQDSHRELAPGEE